MNEWIEKYIGIPYLSHGASFGAVDCFGLIRLVYQNERGVTLNVFEYGDADDSADVCRAIEDNKGDEWRRIKQPEQGCVLLLNVKGYATHCGLYVGENRMLHSIKGCNSCIEKTNGLRWKSRIEGYYRYVGGSQ
ncbi:hypothetical protein DRH27_00560 [Candidatus Falkowbacteria bacterium]|nr:MAG: hypothetical protein DRH27_00560 [Candidatus Falkowbacteria bacterium]